MFYLRAGELIIDRYTSFISFVSNVLEYFTSDKQPSDSLLTMIKIADGYYNNLINYGHNSEQMIRYIKIRNQVVEEKNLGLELLTQ